VLLSTAVTTASTVSAAAKAMWGWGNYLWWDSEIDGASLNREGFSVDESIGDFFMCGFEDSAEGLARDVHFLRGLLLIQTLQVS
jgi:hypothetical protein